MNALSGSAEQPAVPTDGGDDLDLADALRRMDDRFAADADRYSRWADELAADGLPAGAELARRMADHLLLIVDECQRTRKPAADDLPHPTGGRYGMNSGSGVLRRQGDDSRF